MGECIVVQKLIDLSQPKGSMRGGGGSVALCRPPVCAWDLGFLECL